jgi:hypothetical protein
MRSMRNTSGTNIRTTIGYNSSAEWERLTQG